jgi:hypothetical protein
MVISLSAAALVIRDAVPRDAFVVTQVLSAVFAGSAIGRWLDPDSKTQHLSAAGHPRGRVSDTITCGVARVIEDDGEIVSVALWSICGLPSRGGVPHPAATAPALLITTARRCLGVISWSRCDLAKSCSGSGGLGRSDSDMFRTTACAIREQAVGNSPHVLRIPRFTPGWVPHMTLLPRSLHAPAKTTSLHVDVGVSVRRPCRYDVDPKEEKPMYPTSSADPLPLPDVQTAPVPFPLTTRDPLPMSSPESASTRPGLSHVRDRALWKVAKQEEEKPMYPTTSADPPLLHHVQAGLRPHPCPLLNRQDPGLSQLP